jgi:type II secretory ATPase GspE/PulE/Tfp pilus assembly ATPase PilB-like protein
VNPDIGLSFASALRHILRQDPDVIMVGEIRDQETAEIAIRASLTGHLVLSTLHTNDASGAINRLIDMEIEPFLIASSIEMVIAQRLIRRLCKSCAEVAGFSEAYVRTCLDSIGIQDSFEVSSIFANKGCDQCRNSGYKGRLGVYEILIPNERVKEMIVQNASAKDIHNEAINNGMRTLQSCSWEQVKLGNTSMEELMKLDLKLNLEENSDEKLDA